MCNLIKHLVSAIRNILSETKGGGHENSESNELTLSYMGSIEQNRDRSIVLETDSCGHTLLQRAVLAGQVDVVISELQRGGPIPTVCCHPLHLACGAGQGRAAVTLLNYGTASLGTVSCVCQPENKDQLERYKKIITGGSVKKEDVPQLLTALEVTVLYDRANLLKTFVGMKLLSDELLFEAFVTSAKYGSEACLWYLLGECGLGGRVTREDAEGVSPLEYVISWGLPLTGLLAARCSRDLPRFRSQRRETLLHVACRTGRSAEGTYHTVRYLLSVGLRRCVNELDIDGYSPLHVLLRRKSYDECHHMVAKDKCKRCPNASRQLPHTFGRTDAQQSECHELSSGKSDCSEWACQQDFKCLTVRALLAEGSDADRWSPEGCHPLYIAVQYATSYQQMLSLVYLILKYSKDPTSYSDRCRCARSVGTHRHGLGIVQLILQRFDFIPEPYSDTLHYSHLCSLTAILHLLANHGLRIDPVHFAGIWRYLLTVLDRISDPWETTSGLCEAEVSSETGRHVTLTPAEVFVKVMAGLFDLDLGGEVTVEYSCWDLRVFGAVYLSLVVRTNMAVGVRDVVKVLRALLQGGVRATGVRLPVDALPHRFRSPGPYEDPSDDLSADPQRSLMLHTLIGCYELALDDTHDTCGAAADMTDLLKLVYTICDHGEAQASIHHFLKHLPPEGSEAPEAVCRGPSPEQGRLSRVFWDQLNAWQGMPQSLYWIAKKRLRHLLRDQMSNLSNISLPDAIKEDVRSFI